MKKICKTTIILLVTMLMGGLSSSQATELPGAKGILDLKVQLRFHDVSLEEVLDNIALATEIEFLYSPQRIHSHQKVTVNADNESLGILLNRLLDQLNIGYELVEGNTQILLFRKEKVNQLSSAIQTIKTRPVNVYKMDREITGIVTDVKGTPLIGVNILNKSQPGRGGVTDMDGRYSLMIPEENITLIFSYIGYKTLEINVEDQEIVNVVMEENIAELDEIVVVGFGTKDRQDITGAVNSLEMDDVLGDRPVTDAAKALQGSLPGLEISYGSGQPGTGTDINIRGFESINGGSPLVLVNNVPMSIDDINPRDIQSVTVLKDAASASIYGARAAFGVILITTKGGKKNQPVKFDYSTTLGWNTPISLPEKAPIRDFVQALKDWGQTNYWTGQNVDTWLSFIDEYNSNPSTYPDGVAYDENDLRYDIGETDVYKKFLGDPGFQQIHNFAFSGGSEKSTYRVSVGMNDENGIMNGDNDTYRRYNVSADLSSDITPKLTATFNTIYKNGLRRGPLSGNWNSLYYSAINYHSAIPTGYTDLYGDLLPWGSPDNLVEIASVRKNYDEITRFFGKLEYNLVKNLTLNGEYTFQRTNTKVEDPDYVPTYVNPANLALVSYNPSQTSYFQSSFEQNYLALNLYGRYNLKAGNHEVGLLLGLNQEESSNKGFSASRNTLITPGVPGLSTSIGNINVDDSYTDFGVIGFFGRINYDYKNKYLLEINGRYDGSSRFPEKNRFGFFPSVSAAWKVTSEPFMQTLQPLLSSLKIRASFGEIGNQNINNYAYLPSLNAYNPAWINANTGERAVSLNPPSLVSSGFTWERVRTLNFGADVAFLDNRLYAIFDIYNRQTLDMLAQGAELPSVLGASAPLQNVADLSTKGWELDLSWRENLNKISYRIGLNLYDSRTEITKFDNEEGLLNQYYPGQLIGDIWGYTTDGFYTVDDFVEGTLNDDLTGGTLKEGVPVFKGQSPNPGDVKYADINGDGEVFSGNNTLADPGDRTVIGNSTRRFQFGVNGSIEYQNFDFSLFVQGVGKRNRWLNNAVIFPYTFEFTTIYSHQLDYWTRDNTNAFYPRNYPNGSGNYGGNRQTQTKYLLNGAYMRLKNITLGYSLPQVLLNKIGIYKFRIFASAENIWTLDDLPQGIDAELNIINNGGTYPFLKNYSAGINLTF